jgi:hypothetical protein
MSVSKKQATPRRRGRLRSTFKKEKRFFPRSEKKNTGRWEKKHPKFQNRATQTGWFFYLGGKDRPKSKTRNKNRSREREQEVREEHEIEKQRQRQKKIPKWRRKQ